MKRLAYPYQIAMHNNGQMLRYWVLWDIKLYISHLLSLKSMSRQHREDIEVLMVLVHILNTPPHTFCIYQLFAESERASLTHRNSDQAIIINEYCGVTHSTGCIYGVFYVGQTWVRIRPFFKLSRKWFAVFHNTYANGTLKGIIHIPCQSSCFGLHLLKVDWMRVEWSLWRGSGILP